MIILEKLNRAVSALIGSVITFFVLINLENKDTSILISFIVGSAEDGYMNLHTLLLIISMMIIVEIFNEAGVFQYISIRLIKLSKGKPSKLLINYCFLTFIIAATLNNLLAVMILIPLTINISRILNLNPMPYILCEAILVNMGSSLFLISCIPNILISAAAGISFIEFFLNIGLIAVFIFIVTVFFFKFLYSGFLTVPSEKMIEVLNEFNPWNVVINRKLLKISLTFLFILIGSFVVIPSTILAPDMVALIIALTLMVVSRLSIEEIWSKVDLDLIFYLIGISIIVGGMEEVGIIAAIGNSFSKVGNNSALIQSIFILWASAGLSANIDNIPITKVLIPVIDLMVKKSQIIFSKILYYSLAIGGNWGDNLTPLGDNVLVMKIAEEHKRPVSIKAFFKLGFTTSIIQLAIVSLLFCFIIPGNLNIGIFILLIIFGIVLVLYILKRNNENFGKNFQNFVNKFRKMIIE